MKVHNTREKLAQQTICLFDGHVKNVGLDSRQNVQKWILFKRCWFGSTPHICHRYAPHIFPKALVSCDLKRNRTLTGMLFPGIFFY